MANSEIFESLTAKIEKYSVFLSIAVNGETAGYAAFYANDNDNRTAYITLICIKSKFQNMHLGSRLIEECCDVSRKSGMTKIRLQVNKNNPKAISFYLAKGFIQEREETETSYYMRKAL